MCAGSSLLQEKQNSWRKITFTLKRVFDKINHNISYKACSGHIIHLSGYDRYRERYPEGRRYLDRAQATQIHITNLSPFGVTLCVTQNVTLEWASVALQEKRFRMRNKIIRLRTLNNEKRKLLFNKTCKENLHLMYSIALWCLFISSAEFLGFVAWVLNHYDSLQGWSKRSGGILDEFHQKCYFFPPKIPIRCNLFSSKRKGKSLLVLMSNRLGKTTFPFHIEPFAPCLEAVWFSDACVRPRLLRLPAKPSSSGVSTTCLSSCFPFPFCSCTRRVRVKTVNRNYCISSNRYWVAVPRLACSRRLWLIVAPLNRASANTRAFSSRVFPTIWEPGNRLSLDHLSINRLPRIIVSHTSCHPLFFLPSPCQVDVESDPAKLINDNSNSDAENIDIEN